MHTFIPCVYGVLRSMLLQRISQGSPGYHVPHDSTFPCWQVARPAVPCLHREHCGWLQPLLSKQTLGIYSALVTEDRESIFQIKKLVCSCILPLSAKIKITTIYTNSANPVIFMLMWYKVQRWDMQTNKSVIMIKIYKWLTPIKKKCKSYKNYTDTKKYIYLCYTDVLSCMQNNEGHPNFFMLSNFSFGTVPEVIIFQLLF